MSLFKQPAPPSVDEPDGLPVPAHLAPYFDAAAEPTETEVRNYWKSPPKEIIVRPIGEPRPLDREIDGLTEMSFDEWAHSIKLRNAEQLRNKDVVEERTEAMRGECALCEQETWTFSSHPLDLDNGRTVNLCAGCYPLVTNEQHLRRHAAKLDELFTGGTG